MDRVERIRSVYEEWERGNYRAGLELYDRNMTLEVHTPIPDADVYHGLAGLQRYMRQFLSAWHDYEIRGVGFEACGDTVVVEVKHSGSAGGARVDATFFAGWTFHSDLVVRVDVGQTRDDVIAGATRAEQPARLDG